jgi:hypothetical protein
MGTSPFNNASWKQGAGNTGWREHSENKDNLFLTGLPMTPGLHSVNTDDYLTDTRYNSVPNLSKVQ